MKLTSIGTMRGLHSGLNTSIRQAVFSQALAVGLLLALPSAEAAPVVPAMSVAQFVDTLGVCTHIPYTDGKYADIGIVADELVSLGIHNVRDGMSNGGPGSPPFSNYVLLAKQGIRFTFVVSGANNAAITDNLKDIVRLNQAVPGSVFGIEGPNEINNGPVTFDGLGGLDGAVAMQKALYAAVHATPALKGVAVVYFTGYGLGKDAGPNPMTMPGLADFNNQHPYPRAGQAPGPWVKPATVLWNQHGKPGPAVYTETGYATFGPSYDAVSKDVQASYVLDLLFDTARDGVSKTYIYELMDAYLPSSRQGDQGLGLFDEVQAPKKAATAIHNLTTVLNETRSAPASHISMTLDYTLVGLPTKGSSLLLRQANGAFDLAIWNEPEIWDPNAKRQMPAAPAKVTIDLASPGRHITVFDPLLGIEPVQVLADTTTIPLTITDHPLIVEITP